MDGRGRNAGWAFVVLRLDQGLRLKLELQVHSTELKTSSTLDRPRESTPHGLQLRCFLIERSCVPPPADALGACRVPRLPCDPLSA
jgi:hypothetical protein